MTDRVWTPSLWSALDHPAGILAAADRVELKVIVAAAQHGAVLAVLDRPQRRTRRRQVYYLDTPDLALARCGMIVRARRTRRPGGGGCADSMVKLRRPVPVELTGRVRRSPNLAVELDALPGRTDWAASLRRSLGPSVVAAAVTGQQRWGTLLSAEQHAFLRAHTTRVDDLLVHGPVEVTRTPAGTTGFAATMIVECWVFPDRSRLVELSTRCRTAHAGTVAARARGFLDDHGVTPAAVQTTKTRACLDYFTRRHRHPAADPRRRARDRGDPVPDPGRAELATGCLAAYP